MGKWKRVMRPCVRLKYISLVRVVSRIWIRNRSLFICLGTGVSRFGRDGLWQKHKAFVDRGRRRMGGEPWGGVGWHGYSSTSAYWRSRSTEDLLVSRGEIEHRCCQVSWGAGGEQVSWLPLTSTLSAGALFHYQAPGETYALSFADARRACQQSGAEMASAAQLIAAHHSGYSSCSAGWLSDQTVRWGRGLEKSST